MTRKSLIIYACRCYTNFSPARADCIFITLQFPFSDKSQIRVHPYIYTHALNPKTARTRERTTVCVYIYISPTWTRALCTRAWKTGGWGAAKAESKRRRGSCCSAATSRGSLILVPQLPLLFLFTRESDCTHVPPLASWTCPFGARMFWISRSLLIYRVTRLDCNSHCLPRQ